MPAKKPAAKKTARKIPTKAAASKSVSKKAADEKPRELSLSGTTDRNFFEQVYDVARMIPKGRVTSYGAIAASLGAKSSSRMVGWAMNGCHFAKPKVPAHRVVNRNGMLTGKFHFEDHSQMARLLAKEGVKVKNDQVVDFRKHFWDPSEELGF